MAKVEEFTARKDYICSKCNRTIHKKEKYKQLKRMYKQPIKICSDCNFARSETTSSEYKGIIWDIQDNLRINSQDDIDECLEELEDLKEIVEERFYEMPEHLRYSSPTGELLEERIDALESVISELDKCEYAEDKDVENKILSILSILEE